MPEHFVREMVADWIGAGRAQGHGDDIVPWYRRNAHIMVLHPQTSLLVEHLLSARNVTEVPAAPSPPRH